jgi:hypothetical protein
MLWLFMDVEWVWCDLCESVVLRDRSYGYGTKYQGVAMVRKNGSPFVADVIDLDSGIRRLIFYLFVFCTRNFIILGALTVLLGILVFFFLPDQPHSTLFHLTPEEEAIVDERTQDNAVVRQRVVNYAHYWEAVKELQFWVLCLTALCIHLPNGGLVVFGNPFVKSLGFSVSGSDRL